MVSNNTPSDSHRASRRSFLGALGLAAGTGLAGLGSATPGRGRGRSEDTVVDGLNEYAVPVASEGEVPMNELVPVANRVAPPGTVGTAASADERTGATVVAGRLSEFPVVGLGESTHGTHEFHAIRRRIVQQLVSEYDLRVVAFEARFSEMVALNDYVVHGEGSFDAMPAGIWRTAEVRRLVEWLREFNRGRPREDRVEVHGVDMQGSADAASALLSYLDDVGAAGLEHERDVLTTLAESTLGYFFEGRSPSQSRIDTVREIVAPIRERLTNRRDSYVAATSEYAWQFARRHLRTLEQALEWLEARMEGFWTGWETRDEFMAENTTWLHDTLHSDQVVVWGHNNHVKTGWYLDFAPAMGNVLAETHGEGYYSLGFDFGTGTFSARVRGDPDERTPTIEEPIAEGSALLNEVDHDQYFVDFAAASEHEAVAEWIDQEQKLHASGFLFLPNNPADDYHLEDSFDGLVSIRTSTPTTTVPMGEQ